MTCGQVSAAYSFVDFYLPGVESSSALDISDDGQVVGSAQIASKSFGFIWSEGKVVFLSGPVGSEGAIAYGISSTGTVVGTWYNPADGGRGSPFIYRAGDYLDITGTFLSSTSNFVRGISPNGRYIAGTIGLNEGFVYDLLTGERTAVIMVAGSRSLIVQGVNSFGLVAGSYSMTPGSATAFIYDINSKVREDFNVGDALRSAARGITDSGLMVGWAQLRDGSTVGWSGNLASRQVFSVFDDPNTTFSGVNELGYVVGNYGTEGRSFIGVLATPVPEPSSTVLALVGLVFVIARLRKTAVAGTQ
jgi:uncharacterized membrane protein